MLRPLFELASRPRRDSRLSAAREPFYEEVAHVVVDVDDLEPDEVTERILAAVGADLVIDVVESGGSGPGTGSGTGA